ncbi:MAG TPA: ferritin family protein [Geobacteraceae bacterium]|nr:ferritin family protein [Geobacteraceae bacterium]
MNVFDFAMQMEIDGKAHYEKLAAGTSTAGLQNIFLKLAADEQKHYEMIQAMKVGDDYGAMTSSTALDEAKNVFQGIMNDKTLLGGLRKDLDGYRYAMKVEVDSVKLYEDMAKKENSLEIVQLLLKIANEEKKHYNIMENLYDFVLAPQNYLAWAEFSNLKEF